MIKINANIAKFKSGNYNWKSIIGKSINFKYYFIDDYFIAKEIKKNNILVDYNGEKILFKKEYFFKNKLPELLCKEICKKYDLLYNDEKHILCDNEYNDSFEYWCICNDMKFILDLWDYRNVISPKQISKNSQKTFYIRCNNKNHGLTEIIPYSIVTGNTKNVNCKYCNSIKEWIIFNYGNEYFEKYWSSNNSKEKELLSTSSSKKIIIKCVNNLNHPEYEVRVHNFVLNNSRCPYCSGRKVLKEESFGYFYPDAIKYWSSKNEMSPYEYAKNSNKKVWIKCKNNKHDDFGREICAINVYGFNCRLCSFYESLYKRSGENSANWKGGVTSESDRERKSKKYIDWRTLVYEKDFYTCQCCGNHGNRLNGHHIFPFSKFEDLRYDVINGMTLCINCHDSTISGSFHNTYGTHNNTPEQLEEYINNKRKQLGINIPFNIEEYHNGNILKPNDISDINNIDKYIDTRKMKKISELAKMKPITNINQMN